MKLATALFAFSILLAATLACSIADQFTSPTDTPAPAPPVTKISACAPVKTAADEGDILYNAQVAEHAQAQIRIQILTPKAIQTVEFIKPDRFFWHSEAGGVWDEAMSIGGTAYARGSAEPTWKQVPVLNPMAAIMMQPFIDPPKKNSGADLLAQLTKSGIANPKIEGRLVGYDPVAFFGSCVYELTFKSGDTVVYSQKTWIDPATGVRNKFEAKDETRTVIETRLFDYDGIKIEAP